MNISYESCINRDGEKIIVIVYGEIHRKHRGKRDSLEGVLGAGAPLEPDEPSTVILNMAKRSDDESPIELTEQEYEQICEKIHNCYD